MSPSRESENLTCDRAAELQQLLPESSIDGAGAPSLVPPYPIAPSSLAGRVSVSAGPGSMSNAASRNPSPGVLSMPNSAPSAQVPADTSAQANRSASWV